MNKRTLCIIMSIFIVALSFVGCSMATSETNKGDDRVMKQALIVIDIQNDYFEGGKFPLWNTDVTLTNNINAIKMAQSKDIPVILIKHVSDGENAPFFAKGSEGVKIHSEILRAAPDAKVVIKTFADSFHKTDLEKVLSELKVDELLVTGMMTQNCVTHTAISKAAENYSVKVLQDCTTTVNEPIHYIALDGMSTRVELVNSTDILK